MSIVPSPSLSRYFISRCTSSFVASAARVARAASPQALANTLLAFAVFDARPPRDVAAAARDAFADAPRAFGREERMQCFQAVLAEAAAGRLPLDLGRDLADAAEAAWRSKVDDTTVSAFHRDVAATLDRLGHTERVLEGATDDGLFRVDCLLADGRTAVDADGPSHFVNGRAFNGATRLRRRLLEARGLRVVSVPFFEWGPLATDEAKEAYLGARIA